MIRSSILAFAAFLISGLAAHESDASRASAAPYSVTPVIQQAMLREGREFLVPIPDKK